MTAEPDHDTLHPTAAHEAGRRSGSIVLVLLVAGGIVAAAVALMTIGRAQAQPYILGLLALLAMVGLFNLFAFAAGLIRFVDRAADDPVMGRISDNDNDGLAVTDSRGHVVYSNATYLALTGAATAQDVASRRTGLHRQSRCVGGGVPAAQGGARRQAPAGGSPHRRAATAAMAAGCACGFGRSGKASGMRNTRYGRSPISRATASARKTSSRNCSTRSSISIMHRAGSSRSILSARSSTSMRRSRTGWIMISRRSARAG